MVSRRPFLWFYKASVSAVAIGVILGSPATADSNCCRLVEFENMRRDIGDRVRAVTKRRILGSGAAAIGDAFGYLFDNRWFD